VRTQLLYFRNLMYFDIQDSSQVFQKILRDDSSHQFKTKTL